MSSIDLYIDPYLDQLRSVSGLSENTRRAYGSDLAAFARWCDRAGVDALALTHRELRAYLGELSRARYATTTINRHLSAVRGLYAWIGRHGVEASGAAAAAASPKAPRTLPRAITDEQASRLLDACEPSDAAGLRDRAFLELLYATGARVSEASALDTGSFDFGSAQVRFIGKGDKERVVPVYEAALDWVRRYEAEARPALLARAKRDPADSARALLLSARGNRMSAGALREAFERRRAAAGLPSYVTPHTMRHTFATELLGGGADLRSVQELLGHESLQTTQIYTHLSVERLKSAARCAHPRA